MKQHKQLVRGKKPEKKKINLFQVIFFFFIDSNGNNTKGSK